MNTAGVARAFAKALLDSVLASGEGERIRADVLRLQADVEASPALRDYCRGRHASTPEAREETVCALWKGQVSPRTLLTLRQLARWDALPALPLFLKRFLTRYDAATGTRVAHAAFALPPTESDLAALREKLQARFPGDTVDLRAEVNPALLAGFTLDVGDIAVDASLQGRLRRMRR